MQKFGFCLQDLLKSSSPKLLDRILRYCTQTVFWYVLLRCSNSGATYIMGKIIAKNNLNIVNLMQTFENPFPQNY